MASSERKSTSVQALDDDDEVDFMSDEFLEQCTKNDVRPGLLFNHSEKRKHAEQKRNSELQEKVLESKELEERNRVKGLNSEIGADNKGFKILEKMGFKPGERLGKRAGSCGALREPIPIELKRGRGCLGQKTKFIERKKEVEALADVGSFRERLQNTSVAYRTKSDLKKAQSVCQILDEKANVMSPIEAWYWPPDDVHGGENEEVNDSEDDEPDSLPEPFDQLSRITDYLRATYLYCIWCGTEFNDTQDLIESCPGLTREDH